MVGGALNMMLARATLFAWLEAVTGAVPIGGVKGRLVQSLANGRDELGWHTDEVPGETRQLGVVVNLSDSPFEGGSFELRRTGAVSALVSHRYDRPGSMMVFAVRSDLQHRVTALTSGGPRRVWAGWFLAEPETRGLPGG